jgi:predicted Zn finger-like uncharacterized protein
MLHKYLGELRGAGKNVMPVVIMRISCPTCLTEYDVPDAAIAGRSRTLRCAHCGHQWRYAGASAPEFAAPAGPPEPVPAILPREPTLEAASAPTAPYFSADPPLAAYPSAAPLPVLEPSPPPSSFWATPPEPEPAPSYSWAPPPASPAGWPDFPAEQASLAEPPATPRLFGQPADEETRHQIETEAAREAAGTTSLFSDSYSDAPAAPPPLSDADFRQPASLSETDSFAALVSAARRKSLEYEPEPAPVLPVRTSNMKLFVTLVVLFILGMVVLERHYVMHAIPASTKIFHAIGLN